MGNRAVITTNKDLTDVGIYLHWNGGRDSVEAFLAYCDLKGYRSPSQDSYGWVCLAGVIFNTFGNGMSCGINIAKRLDTNNFDNGTYIIKDWLIVDRMFFDWEEQLEYDFMKCIKYIDERQQEHMRLTAEQWTRFDEVKAKVMQARTKAE